MKNWVKVGPNSINLDNVAYIHDGGETITVHFVVSQGFSDGDEFTAVPEELMLTEELATQFRAWWQNRGIENVDPAKPF